MGKKVHSPHGRFVKMTPTEFFNLVHQLPDAKVVASKAGRYRYLVRYEGFTFHTQSEHPLTFTPAVQPLSTAAAIGTQANNLQPSMA